MLDPEPNNDSKQDQCIRLRGNLLNDVNCMNIGSVKSNKPSSQSISFICEHTPPPTTTTTTTTSTTTTTERITDDYTETGERGK